MKKEDLRLVCTCESCPEQYDVFAEGYSYQVGYIRFRCGWFSCQTLDETGNILFRPIIVAWEDSKGSNEIPAIVKDDLLDICKDAICQYFTTKERLNLVDEKYKEYLSTKYDMETKFNFNSQICTSRSQSERLLALGLKKETADMFWWDNGYGSYAVISRPVEKEDGEYGKVIPAWSLHKLIEMMPNNIHKYNDIADLSVSNELVQYRFYDVDYNHDVCLEHFNDGTLFDNIIDCIEWLIKEGYFPKEYLEE